MPEQRVSLIVTADARGFETEIRRARRETNELGREFREGKRDADRLNRSADDLVREMREMSAATARSTIALERLGRLKWRNNDTFRRGVETFATGALASATGFPVLAGIVSVAATL